MTDLLMVTKVVQRRLHYDLAKAVAKEQDDIRSALEAHTPLAEHYWQNRHKLEQQVKAINAVVEVLEECR